MRKSLLIISIVFFATNSTFSLERPSFADTVEPLIPTVVNIYTVQYLKQKDRQFAFPFEEFKDFFKDFDLPPFGEMYSNPKATALGSGFLIDSEGYIITNNHVISDADEISVKLSDNTEVVAKIVGTDVKTDIALLKINVDRDLPYVKFGDDQKSRIGDWVIAIGNPFGLSQTVTVGIISSKARDIDLNAKGIVNNYIQTDAAINRGNSGGPMFNLDGEVIAVNTAIYSPSGANAGVGFAIPITTVQKVVDQLKKHGKVTRGLLNIKIQEVTNEIAEGLGLKEKQGVLVSHVYPGGAGARSGLKSGDIILEFNNKKVSSGRELQILVAETPINSNVSLLVFRDGKNISLKVVVLEEKTKTDSNKERTATKNFILNGITFADLDENLRDRYNLSNEDTGVLVSKVSEKSLWKSLVKGDLLLSINQQEINNTKDLENIYNSSKSKNKKNIVIMVKRGESKLFLALPLE